MPSRPILAVVIPVYNEEASLGALLQDWQAVFKATGVAYKIILIDDGSKDNSLALMRGLQQQDTALEVHTQPNAGHGPAILKGYGLALDAEWVFQIDSDHQLDPGAFSELWANRAEFDLLIAQRADKNATAGRQRISAISMALVRLLYGGIVKDVNCPYRLMRVEKLRPALEKIPEDSFAPNVLLTCWFTAKKSRIFMTTAVNRPAAGLRQSKLNAYFFKGAVQSAIQTMIFRMKL